MLFSFANSVSYSVVSNVCLTDCPVKFANAGQRKNVTGYVKRNYAKEQLKRNHGHRNHLRRSDLTIVANNKNSSFDRRYEGQALCCYMIRFWFMLFSKISFVNYVNKCMNCSHALSSEWVWTCGQEYEIKASYHWKITFAEKKKYFFHCRIMYLTLLSRSLHYNINNNNICFICI